MFQTIFVDGKLVAGLNTEKAGNGHRQSWRL